MSFPAVALQVQERWSKKAQGPLLGPNPTCGGSRDKRGPERTVPKQDVQLRGDDHNVLTNEQELSFLSTFCQELFLSKAADVPLPDKDPLIRLEEHELRWHIAAT